MRYVIAAMTAAAAASAACAVPASADNGCQFSAGSVCAAGPQDDYADIYGPYSPGYDYGRGFGMRGGPGLWVTGLVPDDAGPGISAGPGTP